MFGSLATGIKDLGFRFTVSGLLPFLLLVAAAFGLAAVATGPGSPPHAVVHAGAALGVAGGVTLLALSFVLAVVSQPFQVAIVRFLEGYWGASPAAVGARGVGVELHRRRAHRLRLAETRARQAGELEEAGYLGRRLARYPADPAQMLPTLLGNTLRAGERNAGERYGLDTVRAWSRLYYLLPEPFQRDVADLHGQVDGAARLTVALGLAGAAAVPVMAPHGWWNLTGAALLVLAVLAYRGGVAAAAGLGTVLSACFDLNRFALTEGMRLPPPKNTAEEHLVNARLDAFLAGTEPGPLLPGVRFNHA